MQWFAVQSVVRHRDEQSGEAIYEERLLLYRVDSVEHAADRAQKDTASYIAGNPGFSEVSSPSIYALNETVKELDGAEAWSCLHRGPGNAAEFWRERYEKYSL